MCVIKQYTKSPGDVISSAHLQSIYIIRLTVYDIHEEINLWPSVEWTLLRVNMAENISVKVSHI